MHTESVLRGKLASIIRKSTCYATHSQSIASMYVSTFDNTVGAGVNVGMEGFETTSGIAVEAVIVSNWSGAGGDYDEIFRKEDGGNRILFGFQNDPFSDGANPPVTANIPVLSFGRNAGRQRWRCTCLHRKYQWWRRTIHRNDR
ncbi:MAG: hypothetical protein R3F19_16725 [Verrucomicrobiales bacterium]